MPCPEVSSRSAGLWPHSASEAPVGFVLQEHHTPASQATQGQCEETSFTIDVKTDKFAKEIKPVCLERSILTNANSYLAD